VFASSDVADLCFLSQRIDLKPGAGFVGALNNQFVVVPIKYPFISRILGKQENSPFGFRGNIMTDKVSFVSTSASSRPR